jgi:hypothetical protein
MTSSEPTRPAAHRTRALTSSSFSAVPTMGTTIYGCGRDEAAAFQEIAPRFGIMPTITEAAVAETNVGLAVGNRCISVWFFTPGPGRSPGAHSCVLLIMLLIRGCGTSCVHEHACADADSSVSTRHRCRRGGGICRSDLVRRQSDDGRSGV